VKTTKTVCTKVRKCVEEEVPAGSAGGSSNGNGGNGGNGGRGGLLGCRKGC
jgi:hypothetical protein